MNRYRRNSMLREGKKKLSSSNGASLAVALLFFVFMAVVGSSILAAASSSMGRIKDEDQGNQESYALYSAANLVVNAFSDQDAFSFQDGRHSSYLIKNTGTTVYYVNNETGERYSDPALRTAFSAENAEAGWAEPSYKTDMAGSLEDIRYQMSEDVFKRYWNRVLDHWNEGEVLNWSSFVADQSDAKNDKPGEYHFEVTADDSWSENAKAFQTVDVTLTMENNLDIVGKLTVHKPDDEKLRKEITGQKYYIRIPFSSDAQIICETDGNPQENVSDTSTEVIETRMLELQNFQWEKNDQAVISTRKSEVE